MTEETADKRDPARGHEAGGAEDMAHDESESDLQAEQESAAAMDADVPQPPDESQPDAGQPA